MKLTNEAWAKWRVWIDAIKKDLSQALHDDEVFAVFSRVADENSEWISQHHGWLFCHFVARCYAARAAIAVRRHLKEDVDSISLMRLLGQIRMCANQITFERYMQIFPADEEDKHDIPWQAPTFRTLSEDGKVVSEAILDADIDRLKRTCAQIEAFADRSLAHVDKRGFSGQVSFADLAKAAAEFDEIASKYITFITSDGYSSIKATIQFPWDRIFDHPLREPKADNTDEPRELE